MAGERVAQLIAKTEQLLRQRAFLRDERRRLRASTEMVDQRKKALSTMQRADWIHDGVKEHLADRHVRINIGGLVSSVMVFSLWVVFTEAFFCLLQMFEASVKVLTRDPNSLLAQLCGDNPPGKQSSSLVHICTSGY